MDDVGAKLAQGEKRLSDQIRLILKHYQQPDPLGLPGAPIPDPMSVPDMKHSFSMYTMNFKEIKVYGLSKFRIEHVRSELALMQVRINHLVNMIHILDTMFGNSSENFGKLLWCLLYFKCY